MPMNKACNDELFQHGNRRVSRLLKGNVLLLPVCVFLMLLAAGCNKTDSEGEHPPENQPKSASISIVISSLGMTFPAGMDENDNPYLNYIEERTGLEIGVN
ncbi:extracellular solute-binding protein, partial [Paenibacillus sp. Dod16]